MISCSCGDNGGIYGVGQLRFVTCRKDRVSTCCGKQISKGDWMYMQSMYDYDDMIPSSPVFLCEECGDMALNLIELGFCFSMNSNIVEQYRDYLKEKDKT